jgi:hypothetical protein
MLCWILIVGGLLIMMGQHDRSEALFYYFRLEDQVPETHLLRLIETLCLCAGEAESELQRYRPSFHGSCVVPTYHGTLVPMSDDPKLLVERVQTGVRIEKRILKVLKGFAEYHDMTLGDVLEGIVLHAFDGKTPFSPASLERIRELKKFYELDLDSSASHRLKEIKAKSPRQRAADK